MDVVLGLHHVTALAGSPQQNLDFYTGFLGLRLVKRTVNFDDPATHHFYFSGQDGEPGTLVTFFPWGRFRPSRKGTGQAVAFTLGVASIEHWRQRAIEAGVTVQGPEARFGDSVLTLLDPDGVAGEMVESDKGALHSITLCESALEPTSDLLGFLGFQQVGQQRERVRFQVPGKAGCVDVLVQPSAERGRMGAGIIHHVAFAVEDEAVQLEWRRRLIERGLKVSPVKDRNYFHSIYFREPGGVLFEIATNGPGFTIDEAPDELGSKLCLPPWLETLREGLEPRLAKVHLP